MLLCYFNCRIDFHLMMMVVELKSQPLNNVVYLTEKIFPHRNSKYALLTSEKLM